MSGWPRAWPKPAARKALAQIRDAEDREHAEKAVKDFEAAYTTKYPKALDVCRIAGSQLGSQR